MCLGDFPFLPGRRSPRSNSCSQPAAARVVRSKGSSGLGGPRLQWEAEACCCRANPWPLPRDPPPVSLLLGKKGLRPKVPADGAHIFPPRQLTGSLTLTVCRLPSAPSPRLRELPPPGLHDVHSAAYSSPAVEEVSPVTGGAACPILFSDACLTLPEGEEVGVKWAGLPSWGTGLRQTPDVRLTAPQAS